LAIYTAKFCVDKVIVEGFCGSGGNVIQVKFLTKYSFQSMERKYMQ
jgi:hypothetical protein